MNIYLDMDDVVADWTGYANSFFKTPGRKAHHYLPDDEWQRLKLRQRMYAELPLKTGAHELVAACYQYCIKHKTRLAFLTALPHDDSFPYAAYDKVHWADQHFANIPVFFGPYAKDKHNFCEVDDVLIDDRASNCESWEKAGGNAVVYTTWQKSEPFIRELLNAKS
jgi:5' nucleotidase, deoxy (Pyrimidine), cytosolic type C protein (NT5C)